MRFKGHKEYFEGGVKKINRRRKQNESLENGKVIVLMCGFSMNHLVDIDFSTYRGSQYHVPCLPCVCEFFFSCVQRKTEFNDPHDL